MKLGMNSNKMYSISIKISYFRYSAKMISLEKRQLDEICRIGTEAIANLRTVSMLRREKAIMSQYNSEVHNYLKSIRKRLIMHSFVYALGTSAMYLSCALVTCYGLLLTSRDQVELVGVLL